MSDRIVDLFNSRTHSSAYATFRPSYPESIFSRLAELAPTTGVAWDVACGTGQATVPLSKFFDRVIGSDVSESQLGLTQPRANITYKLCSAHDTQANISATLGVSLQSVDLITIAQALHWLDHAKFYENVRAFLIPDGVFAAWTYALTPEYLDDPELTNVHSLVVEGLLGPHWAPEKRYIDNQYRDIPFPFEKIIDSVEQPFDHFEANWTKEDMIGYIKSLSAFQTAARNGNGDSLNVAMKQKIDAAWGPDATQRVRFPIFLLAGRNCDR